MKAGFKNKTGIIRFPRFIASLVTFAIIMSGTIPKDLEIQWDEEELSRVIAAQSVLTNFFYHSTLPVKILNKYLGVNAGQRAPFSSHPAKKSENKQKTSNEFAVVSFSQSLSKTKAGEYCKYKTLKDLPYTTSHHSTFNCMSLFRQSTVSNLILMIIPCLFFFSLARSSIEDSSYAWGARIQ